MDTTKLVVGQKIWMRADDQFKEVPATTEYTTCSDGIRRKIHELNCACDDCQENRERNQSWREAGW
jgi:hypothetical protein